MAEPGGEVELQGAVAVKGAVAKGDPDALLAQIDRTREDLARTIDSLAERVSPASNIRKVRATVAQQAARPEVILGAVAIGAAVVGIMVLRSWARHRRSQ